MKTETSSQIVEYIKKNGASRVHDLVKNFKISPQAIHRHLKKLVQKQVLIKRGTAPVVFYDVQEEHTPTFVFPELSREVRDFIDEEYFYVDANGEVLTGVTGFQRWILNTYQQKAYRSLSEKYVETRMQWRSETSLIDATEKIRGTFKKSYLDHLFYLDFWSLPQFGKPKLAHLLTLGKSGQRKESIEEIAQKAKQPLFDLIKKHKVDSVAFAPHSIPRKLPFLKYFREQLELPVVEIEVAKALIGGIPVAQKSLSKLAEREKNARETILVPHVQSGLKKTLVIDDAVGSGATINELAKKMKEKGVRQVIGFAVVGSLKGFEVIQEI